MAAAVPLLRTKLFIPRVRSEWVARPRLIRRLTEAAGQPLTLISAPAGFGKTTLLADWVAQSEQAVAWVSLDDGDNDPVRFWSYAIVALQTIQPALGTSALGLLESPELPPFSSILTLLLNDLAGLAQSITLVLDDYHLIETQPIQDGMVFLLDHLPPQLRLIIASRADPFLPLARLRARGNLLELRAHDLRFTPDEAATFLNQAMALNLTAADISSLEQQTEGWIAGLQLAALSMQGRQTVGSFIDGFAGTHRYIIDYLTDEVLEQRPADTKDFLLKTSILNRLCGSLCDALTGDKDGQAVLERLEQANVFLVPLDDERRWYRYHHLFAEVVHSRLLSDATPETIAALYRRAVDWCEAEGLLDEAIGYALAIPDETLTAEILERHAMTAILRGEGVRVRRWLAAVPETVILARPQLLLRACWAMFTSGASDRAESFLIRGAAALDQASEMDSVRVERLVLRMSVARYRGDFGTTMALHQEVLPHLPQAPLWLRAIAAQNVGYIQLRYGDIAAGLTALEEVAVLDDPSTIYMALASWTTLGRAYARRGSLSRALETTTQAQKLVARAAGVRLPLAGLPDVTAGEILVEQNELDLAEQAIREGLNLLLGTVAHTHIIPGYVALARVRAARGDLSHALETLDEGEMLLQERQVANHPILRLLSLYRARLLIRLGRLDEADRLINQTTDNRDLAVFHLLTEARLLLRQTAHTGSTDSLNRLKILLDEELATAEANGWTRDVIEILILRSLTQAIADRSEAANADLIHALTLAGPERYIRLFLDEGEPLRRLLQQVNPTSTSPELLTELRAAFIGQNHESRQDATSLGRERVEVVSPPAGPASTNTAALIEPLTDREIELLQLVAAGQSNQEIAQQLFLAVGTVKKHLNNIFGKLGVSSRTQAAARARELELL